MHIERKTKSERRFSPAMGVLSTRVTYIRKTLLGIPVKTLYRYRDTYYGEIKDCSACSPLR